MLKKFNLIKFLKIAIPAFCVAVVAAIIGIYFGVINKPKAQIKPPENEQQDMQEEDVALAKQFNFLQIGNGEDAFYCLNSALTFDVVDVEIPSTFRGLPVKEIGYGAFSKHSEIISVTIPSSITTIDAYAFFKCTGLESLVLPDSVEAVDMYAFDYCTSLEKLKIVGDAEIGQYAFASCSKLESVDLGEGEVGVGANAFSGCSDLVDLNLGNTTKIGNAAFAFCSSLARFCVPAATYSIGTNITEGCTALAEIVVDENNRIYKSAGQCLVEKTSNILLFGCKTSEIAEGILEISDYAFSGCSTLLAIDIPASVKKIGSNTFFGCVGVQTIEVDDLNTIYESGGNCLIEKASKTLLFGCMNSQIPADVKIVAQNAFRGCANLTEIELPASVESVDRYAFADCDGLVEVALGRGIDWNDIVFDTYAFGNMYNQNTINFVVDVDDSLREIAQAKIESLDCKKQIVFV